MNVFLVLITVAVIGLGALALVLDFLLWLAIAVIAVRSDTSTT